MAGTGTRSADEPRNAGLAPPAALTPSTPRHRVSPDRRSLSPGRFSLLLALVSAMLWSSLASLPGSEGAGGRAGLAAGAAGFCAVLAMVGLRSVPIRWIVRGLALVSGGLLARFGELGAMDGVRGSAYALIWLAALAGALALSPSSRMVPGLDTGTVVRADDTPPPRTHHRATDGASDPAEPARRPRSRASVPVALVLAAVALVGAGALLLGPRIATLFPIGPSAGDTIDTSDARGDNALVARDTLDMTTRPRLTDEIVMTVRSSIVAFWRAETFDRWDGSTWTRSEGRSGSVVQGGRIVPSPEDLAARIGETSTQEFRLETGYATAVPAPASPVEIDITREVAQREDGTVWSPMSPLGSGTTYSIESRQVPVDLASLREVGSAREAADSGDTVAEAVVEQYAQEPDTTDRVEQLARQVTAGAATDVDRIDALERWMDENTTYSLDAPLAPKGVDVVDDFLFESREGWCEQIASSLVVMARVAGVPARLATGFAPGEWDEVNGRFVVRERDAHAWAEVWFPDTGWVSFDPTADVPLAGTDEATAGAGALDWREVAGVLLLVVGAIALIGAPLVRWLRRRRARRAEGRERRAARRDRWDVAAEARLEAVGTAAGRPRAPAETVTVYSSAVARVVGDERLGDVGIVVDRARYGPESPAGGSAPEFVDEVLSSH
jgi:transglutaminase-like putative cysteine protease